MKAKIWNKKFWLNKSNPKELKFIFEGLLLESGFGILNLAEYYYAPFGYSCIWLISESHLAIHTFPEENKAYIELSSYNKEKFDYFIKKATKL